MVLRRLSPGLAAAERQADNQTRNKQNQADADRKRKSVGTVKSAAWLRAISFPRAHS